MRPEAWDGFDKARNLFAAGRLPEALELFGRWPGDPASCAYSAKCRRLLGHESATSTSVWELTEK